MKVVIVGSGNVATILGRKCIATGNEVLQIMSRTLNNAKELANELNCNYSDISSPINTNAEIVIVAVSDFALQSIGKWLNTKKVLTVHTAGSLPCSVLEGVSANYGCLYPFQSLHKKTQYIPEIPFLVNGVNDDVIEAISNFVKALNCNSTFVNDADRLKFHAMGVAVNNFPNHIYALVEDFCIKNNLNYQILTPLIIETATRAVQYHPHEMQTGPALRNDAYVMDKHLKVFKDNQALHTLYIRMTNSIIDFYEQLRKSNA